MGALCKAFNVSKSAIKTSKLSNSKVGRNAFKGIYSKAKVKVPKSKLKSYKTMLRKKGVGKKAVIKK